MSLNTPVVEAASDTGLADEEEEEADDDVTPCILMPTVDGSLATDSTACTTPHEDEFLEETVGGSSTEAFLSL
jgi:hypothetical protein